MKMFVVGLIVILFALFSYDKLPSYITSGVNGSLYLILSFFLSLGIMVSDLR